ncbi:hypothetical protein D3C77_706410 [compost metagenome]
MKFNKQANFLNLDGKRKFNKQAFDHAVESKEITRRRILNSAVTLKFAETVRYK